MTNIMYVNSLTKRTCCDHARNLIVSERALNALACLMRQSRMIKYNLMAHLRDGVTKHTADGLRLLAGINVGNALLA